jgi:hypothetical protein
VQKQGDAHLAVELVTLGNHLDRDVPACAVMMSHSSRRGGLCGLPDRLSRGCSAPSSEEGTAQHLVGVPAEQGGGGRVPACDDEIGIELEEGVAGVLQHVLQAALLLPQAAAWRRARASPDAAVPPCGTAPWSVTAPAARALLQPHEFGFGLFALGEVGKHGDHVGAMVRLWQRVTLSWTQHWVPSARIIRFSSR